MRRFLNTANLESGADRLETPELLDAWLASERRPGINLSRAELKRLVALRERLRDHVTARSVDNEDGTPSAVPTDLFPELTIRIAADPKGHVTFTAAEHHGIDAFLVELATALVAASATGTLTRLKTCTNPHCRWAYYDWSRNSGGRWCSMQACGGRHKARAYRRRRVDGDPEPAPPLGDV